MGRPFAYLITFTCYGTWLHGDERTSVDDDHRIYNAPKADPSVAREVHREQKLKNPPIKLDAAMRGAVDEAIRGVCDYRKWQLFTLNVRTNHVHVVVAALDVPPEKIMADFKAYATRKLREHGLVAADTKIWTHHGSTKYVWTNESLGRAITYVADAQGPDLPML